MAREPAPFRVAQSPDRGTRERNPRIGQWISSRSTESRPSRFRLASAERCRSPSAMSSGHTFVVTKISSRGTPPARMPSPTSSSLPYIAAVSMWRYPASSALGSRGSRRHRQASRCRAPAPGCARRCGYDDRVRHGSLREDGTGDQGKLTLACGERSSDGKRPGPERAPWFLPSDGGFSPAAPPRSPRRRSSSSSSSPRTRAWLHPAGRHRFHQHARRDLPGRAPSVLAPPTGVLRPPLPTMASQ